MRMTKPLHCAICPRRYIAVEQPLRDGTLDLLMGSYLLLQPGEAHGAKTFLLCRPATQPVLTGDLWPHHCLHGGWPLHGPNRSTQILPSVPHQLERCLSSLSCGLFTITIRDSNCLQTHTSLGVYYVTAH